jgi:hypothetical protein
MSIDDPGPDTPAARHSASARPVPHRRRRRLLAGATGLLLLVAASTAVAVAEPFDDGGQARGGADGSSARATVREGPLSSQVNQTGALSYVGRPDGSPYSVVNQATGIYTWLPIAGQVIKCGQVLYEVGGAPVVLLCGKTPAYRSLSEGDSGRDVRELNRNLVRLRYADRSELDPSSDDFSSETAAALKRLQDKLGVDETGSLDLGDAAFLPGPVRVARTTAGLGTSAVPGVEVAQATSTRRQVTVDLEASQQSKVKVGDRAQITLPNNRTTPGVVERIGTVATSSSDGGEPSPNPEDSSPATIPVYITLNRPRDVGRLDQAPVNVQITTAGVKRALIVPVTALVGRPGGGFAVETVDTRGTHNLVPVKLGLFDDAAGLVQVSGNLSAGQRVVVPAT